MNKGRFHSPKLQGPAINERIKSKSVRVISEKGEMLGVYDVQDAVKLAFEQGLDLVEVSPNASPPVCKIIDYGKYKYQVQKKQAEAKKKNKKPLR
jgi:translation initiation factor IF-3